MTARTLHGRAVTCTECKTTYGVDLTRIAGAGDSFDPGAGVVYVFPRFVKGRDLVHADGSPCDMGLRRSQEQIAADTAKATARRQLALDRRVNLLEADLARAYKERDELKGAEK